MDVSKLKVPDLKRELKSRGLNISGNKIDLLERLQVALQGSNENEKTSNESVDDLDEDLLIEDDDDHLETTESVISDIDTALNESILPKETLKRKITEDIIEEEKVAAPKKVVLNRNTPIISGERPSTESKEDSNGDNESADDKKVIKLSKISAKERLEMRSKKFDVSLGDDAKKLARADRFSSNSSSNNKIIANVDTSIDVLKKRAERFGGSVSKVMAKLDTDDKMEKRKARFGVANQEDKAKLRLERFKESVK